MSIFFHTMNSWFFKLNTANRNKMNSTITNNWMFRSRRNYCLFQIVKYFTINHIFDISVGDSILNRLSPILDIRNYYEHIDEKLFSIVI